LYAQGKMRRDFTFAKSPKF